MEENIADALKMAGSVLLFVMGLSIAILAFSQARESMDIVLSYSDRESLSIEGDSRFYYLSNDNDTSRYVGKETIIPAIYRAYKENYKIVFKFPDDYYLFKKEVKNTEGLNKEKEISTLDLANQSLSSDLESRQFLNGIIYGVFTYEDGKTKTDYISKFNIKPNNVCLYNYLTEKEKKYKIKESLGTYYIEDVNETREKVNNVNKTEKRVITYEFVN